MSDNDLISFSYDNTRRLIQMVQSQPCLWDRQAPDYKDRLARDRAWTQVFEELDPQYRGRSANAKHDISNLVTKKWNNIRDSYVKSLKPDYLGRRNRQYIHAELLGFLDDGYLEKINSTFLEKMNHQPRNNPQDEDNEGMEGEELGNEADEPWEHKVYVNLDEEPSQKRLRIDYSPEQREPKTNDEDIIAVLSSLIQKEEDEDRAFFKSITPSVKRLSEDSKFEFRIEILKLIKKLRAKDKGQNEPNDSDSE